MDENPLGTPGVMKSTEGMRLEPLPRTEQTGGLDRKYRKRSAGTLCTESFPLVLHLGAVPEVRNVILKFNLQIYI